MKDARQPFSFPVKVGHVSANPISITIEADERERRALAKAWGVDAVHAFSAKLDAARWKRDGVRVSGRVHARIEQQCVVTLDPVEQVIDEDLTAIFVPEGSRLARDETVDGELVIDAEAPDLPETFSGDTIDAGAVAAEFAAMAIDQYPRKPGVGFADHVESAEEGEEERPSPFAALKDWKGGPH